MMSTKTGKIPSLNIALKPSLWLTVYYFLMGAMTLVAVFLLHVSLPVKLGAVVLMVAYGSYSYRRFMSKHRVEGIHYDGHNWRLRLSEGEQSVVLLQAVVWPWLIVLNFRCVDGRLASKGWRLSWSVLVLPDSAEKEQRRKLRVMLRHMPVYQR